MRKFLATNLAKLSKALCTSLKLGSGSTVPGRVALAAHPRILDDYYQEIQSKTKNQESISINITGTNGKTTSTGILKKILSGQEEKPIICNDLGANLYFGIAGAFISSSNLLGRLKTIDQALEVDEAALASVTSSLKPKIIAVTNLFRDQLDRFGELDTTQKLINKGIKNAELSDSDSPILVLNADDPYVANLGTNEHHKIFYSVEYAESCLQESTALNPKKLIKNFDASTSQHLRRVTAAEISIKAKVLEENFDSSLIKLETPIGQIDVRINLPGLYNAYNACTAAAAAYAHFDSSSQSDQVLEKIKWGIENYQTNFGRAEEKLVNGIVNQTFLIKNPTGASEVCKHLSKDPNANFLIIINDNYADGRDVSWLWDAEFEHIAQRSNTKTKAQIFISGHRAYDMATRLKYAGVDPKELTVLPDISEALSKANASLSGDELNSSPKLYILPTYTALLELEKLG